jgi:hypothetical protein
MQSWGNGMPVRKPCGDTVTGLSSAGFRPYLDVTGGHSRGSQVTRGRLPAGGLPALDGGNTPPGDALGRRSSVTALPRDLDADA